MLATDLEDLRRISQGELILDNLYPRLRAPLDSVKQQAAMEGLGAYRR